MTKSGKYFCFCASVPNATIGEVPKLVCAIIVAAVDTHTLAISSIAITKDSVSILVPPYFSSHGIPIKPKSAIFAIDSDGNKPSLSIF